MLPVTAAVMMVFSLIPLFPPLASDAFSLPATIRYPSDSTGFRPNKTPLLFLAEGHFCQGIFNVVMKWRKFKSRPGLDAPGAGSAPGPGRLEIPAHGGPAFVDPAGYPSARRAPQGHAAP